MRFGINSKDHAIFSLIASGRITAAEGERLIAIANESRETMWIVGLCLVAACLAQIQGHELIRLLRIVGGQFPALADALSPITNLMGGLL